MKVSLITKIPLIVIRSSVVFSAFVFIGCIYTKVDCGFCEVAEREDGGHTCVVTVSGDVRCWGKNDYGQLGYGYENDDGSLYRRADADTPASAGNVNVGGSVIQIALGNEHSCALLTGGTVRCWGANFSYGQLGYGHYFRIGNNESPASAGDVNVGALVIEKETWVSCISLIPVIIIPRLAIL